MEKRRYHATLESEVLGFNWKNLVESLTRKYYFRVDNMAERAIVMQPRRTAIIALLLNRSKYILF